MARAISLRDNSLRDKAPDGEGIRMRNSAFGKAFAVGAVMLMAAAPESRANPAAQPSPDSAASASSDSAMLERNKALVRSLFEIINGTSLDAIAGIDELVAEDYIQHNPSVGPGREGLRQLLLKIVPPPKALDPAASLSVNLIAEGDFVVRQELRTDGMLVDIFRIEDGKLQEHWDAFRFAPGARRIPGF